jgi:competence protein ComEA
MNTILDLFSFKGKKMHDHPLCAATAMVPSSNRILRMLKLSRLPIGLLALTIAAPVLAQPASTAPNATSPKAPDAMPRGTAAVPNTDLVDINTATTAQLKALPGLSDSDSTKIIQGRPYSDKSQLVSKKVISEATYDRIRDHIVARQPRS